MAPQLPGPEDQGAEPSALSGRPIARIDTTAAGTGLSRFGQGIQQTGQVLQRDAYIEARQKKAQADQDQAFQTQSQFLQFEQSQHDAYAKAAEDVQPGAQGFSDQFVGGYDQQAKQFFANVPQNLRPEMNNKLLELRGRLQDATTNFQTAETSRFAKEQIATGQETTLNRLNANPNDWVSADQDAEAHIKSSPLTPIEKDAALHDWRQRRAEALWQIDNSTDPTAARQRLQNLDPKQAGDTPSVLRHFEGFRSSAYWDVNHYRAGYGSDTTTLADGSVVPITKDTVVTRDDAERDLTRRSQEFANGASNQVGTVAWDRLDGTSRAALTSVAYNYGSLPNSVVKAVRSGDKEAIASAVENLSANPSRRREEAGLIRSGEVGPAPQYADIPFEQRQKLFDASQKDQIQQTNNQVQDYTAFLRSGQGVQTGDVDGSKFARPELDQIYPPDQAAQVRGEIDKAASYGRDVAATEFATPDQLNKIVQDRSDLLKKPEEFRQHAQDMNGLLTVIKERNNQLAGPNADPATYVQRDPDVATAYKAMTQAPDNPVLVSKYADAALAKQAELGLAPEQQRILPADAEQAIVSQFKNQPEGGQNAAQLMQGLQQRWGKYWPQVFGEMSKDLPGSAAVIGSMGRPEQQRGAEQLAQASALGTEALEKAVSDSTRRDIKNAVNGDNGTTSVLEGFSATFNHTNDNRSMQTLGAVRESVYQLALSYAAQGEQGPAAAQHAYDDVIGKAYTMADTYRIPIQYDAGAVQAGAEHILQHVNGDNWAMPTSLAGLPADQTKAAYLDSVKAHGFWVTSKDESGLTLWDGNKPVLTTSGNFVHVGWQELLDYKPPSPEKSSSTTTVRIGRGGGAQVAPAPKFIPAEQTPSSTPDNPTQQSMKENERTAWRNLIKNVTGQNSSPEIKLPPRARDPNNTIRHRLGQALGFIPEDAP